MAYLYDLTDTWNAAGTVFNAIKMNVTNTASAAGSKIVSLQVGATDRFTVDKDGNGYFSGTLQAVGSISSPNAYISGNSGTIGMQDNTASILAYNATGSGGITNTLRFITGAAERVRIDGSGNVGIGTTPSYKLDVSATGNISGQFKTSGSINALYLADAGTTAGSLYVGTVGNDFRVVTGTNEQMRITSAGNTGIGTASPNGKLTVAGAITAFQSGVTDQLILTPQTAGSGVLMLAVNEANNAYRQMTIDGSPVVINTAGAERMRIDGSGNLLVGTTTPAYSTSGRGLVEVNGSSSALIAVKTGDTARGYFGASATLTELSAVGASQPLAFTTNGVERMRIDSSGNVGIGTTAPSNQLSVGGNNTATISLDWTGDNAAKAWIAANHSTGEVRYAAVTNYFPTFYSNNNERMRIDLSGNLLVGKTVQSPTTVGFQVYGDSSSSQFGAIASTLAQSNNTNTTMMVYSTGAGAYRFYVDMAGTVFATSTTISAISDIRLKENVRDLDAGLNTILALKPRRFDWKEGKGKDIKDDMGFIAQEVEEVLPALIGGWKAGEGEPDDLKSVKAGDLIPVLVKAIQELTARVAQLEGN